jgi:hypothetical protein
MVLSKGPCGEGPDEEIIPTAAVPFSDRVTPSTVFGATLAGGNPDERRIHN